MYAVMRRTFYYLKFIVTIIETIVVTIILEIAQIIVARIPVFPSFLIGLTIFL